MARVFVVEDELYIQDLYAELLVVLGHEVVGYALNGEVAVLTYRDFDPPPDLVLMDHRMPIKTGLEATKEILAMHPEAKILVVSADSTIEAAAAEAGASGYLEKPFELSALGEAIKDAIRWSRLKAGPSVSVRQERPR